LQKARTKFQWNKYSPEEQIKKNKIKINKTKNITMRKLYIKKNSRNKKCVRGKK
jgi:hypothetical protein